MTDRRVLQSDALSRELRQWLLARAALWGSEVVATTLVYELSALIARQAPTMTDADQLINHWTMTMREQVRAFGIGMEHP